MAEGNNPHDQYYMKNPEELFNVPTQPVDIDLQSSGIIEPHLQCAAFESPIRISEDEEWFGSELEEHCERALIYDSKHEVKKNNLFIFM